MKGRPISFFLILLLFAVSLFAQQRSSTPLLLKNGNFFPEKNINDSSLSRFNNQLKTAGQNFAVIQFEKIPIDAIRTQLKNAGIQLLDYIPNNAYTISFTNGLNALVLKNANAVALFELSPAQKLQYPLNLGITPSWSSPGIGMADVWISFPSTLSSTAVIKELQQNGFSIIATDYKKYNVLGLRVPLMKLQQLASLPFVEYVQPAPAKDKPLNIWTAWNRDGVKISLLNAPVSVGGKNLKGSNVVIGVGDDADPHLHVDFTNRYINRAATTYELHGTHVSGIVAGAGIRDEVMSGMAPKSTIINQVFSGIFTNAAAYVADNNMVITNNSYGTIGDDCATFGSYTLYSRILDQQAIDLPHLQQVFAAGNSGHYKCAPYPDSFKTVLGDYQSAKNIICVGNSRPVPAGILFTQSSRGPVKDGRLKPDIVAIGSFVDAPAPPPFDYYSENTGTSMAAPAVSGGLGLLYEKFRQLKGYDPQNILMKSLVCNSGDDWGRPGPDFAWGFGQANFWRAEQMLENNHYDSNAVAQGNTNSFNITVPAGMASVKIMLAWNDPPASALAAHTLVNDLDLEVIDPSSNTVLPFILDTLPANIKNNATTGVDHINNIEQVVIPNPIAGTYTVRVKGTLIAQASPQQYAVVYDFVPNEVKLMAPIGNDTYVPGEALNIVWDSYGDPQNTFTAEYSFDNGSSWTTFDANIAAAQRYYPWITIPSVATDKALVRVSKNGTALSSTSLPFVICAQPVVSLASVQCEGYLNIQWTSVTVNGGDVLDYEVMMLRGDEMVPVATTTATNYTFSGLSKDSVYWVTVRPRINGHPGRRAIALKAQPNSGACSGAISDNDIKVNAIIAPQSGRIGTSSALTASTTISMSVKNLDDNAISSYDIKYAVNGGAFVTQNISTPIAAGATVTHNFTVPYDFSGVGNYSLVVVVKNAAAPDPVSSNDTLKIVVKQLANPLITLTTGPGYTDNIETGTAAEYYSRQTGLNGLDRYDFVSNTAYGRIRTFVNTGIANSGSKSLTLDCDQYNSGGTIDSLTGTFNLSANNAVTDDIRLDFQYKNHGQAAGAANGVWIRGDDQKPWINAYDLFANQNDPGSYKKTSSIEIADLLTANAQNFSSSFQIRWGQKGVILAGDNETGNGYTFDDIHLYKVQDDIQMISIDTPIVNSCALTAATPVRVTVRNSANTTISGVKVNFRIDGGAWLTPGETVPPIAANTTIQYTFTATANLSAPGQHLIEARTEYATDSYPDNDTTSVTLINSPVINTFPYLQDFETGNGGFYANGKRSTWEYGTPASVKVINAASGGKAWKTRLTGNYNDAELSYLYSPCFNISGMTNPTLSFSLALDVEDCGGSLCDGAWVEYSNDGVNWTKLGAVGTGTNWYNKNYSGTQLWSIENYTRWHVATSPLPVGLTSLRFRFVMASDPGVNREGVAIDDIHVYDNTNGIFDGAATSTLITQNTSGNNWINFLDGNTNKLVASVHPNNLNLGNTDVQAYINTGAVRYTASQYYHDRNIVIKPTNYTLTDSVLVRFYFTDAETELLLNATGCALCTKPNSAYALGVSKYTDVSNRSNENGTLADDNSNVWIFIQPSQVRKVPFDKGYYAEFKVKNFSEFWLNNGWLNNLTSLPVQVINFAAQKADRDVLLQWKTANEFNIDHYEIQVAKGTATYQTGNYTTIGSVNSLGDDAAGHTYNFTDAELNKTGVRYYRLKIVEKSGAWSYTPVRSVIFTNDVRWNVYPNPSAGIFNIEFQQQAGNNLQVKVYDANGKLVTQQQTIATGFVQKLTVDLRANVYAAGMYMIIAEDDKKQVWRVVKQ